MDVADAEQVKAGFKQVIEKFGRLDILVNSAANFLPASIVSTTEQVWDASLGTNLKAPFFCAQAAAPLLKRSRGAIINFADVGGLLAWTGYIPHCVSKAGVIMLTRCLAKELAPEVRVNAIAPGTITMPGDPPEWEEDFIKRAPLLRSGRPSDVAETVVFLVRSEFITGQVIVVDGGRTFRGGAMLNDQSEGGPCRELRRGVFYGIEWPYKSDALAAKLARKRKTRN